MAFDLVVTKREAKTGRVIEQNDYVLHIDKEGTRFERPPHSGNFFNADGSPIKKEQPAAAQQDVKGQQKK